jgi:hypothetical protein
VAGGVNGWEKYAESFIPYFNNSDVVIIPDNDEPGKRLGQKVYDDLKSCAKQVRCLELPGLEEKEDAADWIAKGGTKEALIKLTEECAASDSNHIDDSSEDETDTSMEHTPKHETDTSIIEETKPEKGETVVVQGPIFIENGCYCRKKDEKTIEITNFIIKPLFFLDSEDNDLCLIKAEVITYEGNILERSFKPGDFDDIALFKKALNSFDLIFTGKVEHLQYIKLIVSSEVCPRRLGVTYEGFHNIENSWYFVTKNKTINEALETDNKLLLLEGFSELHTDLLEVEPITTSELENISSHLFRFNTLSITSTVLGYVCGLYLKAKLQAAGLKYNHLIIEGHSGSGKSSTLENVIVPLLCMDSHLLNASDCTNTALTKSAASSNFVPLVIDEYKPSKIDRYKLNSLSNLLRNSYDNHKAIRGVPTLTKNREFIARTSVVLSGEAGIDENANVERSLKAVFTSKTHSTEASEAMKALKLNKEALNKLGKSLLKGALRINVKDLNEIHQSIYSNIADKNFINERIRNSVANCLLGIHLLKLAYEDLGLDFEESCRVNLSNIKEAVNKGAYEDLLDYGTSSKTIIDNTLETLNRMAANNFLHKGMDYDTAKDSSGERCLRLNYTLFYDRFLKYCREHEVNQETLNLSSFKKQLQKMDFCITYSKPTYFKVQAYDFHSTGKTFRAAVLSLEKLKERNLEIEFLVEE